MSYSIILGSYTPEDAFDIEVSLGINKLQLARFRLPNEGNKYSGVEEMQPLKVTLDSKVLFDGIVDNLEDILKGGDFLGVEGVGKGYKLFNELQTKEYVDVNGKTIIVDAVNLAGLDPAQVDPENEIASTFTKEYAKVPCFKIIEEICRESAKATGEVGFYFYIDTAGVVHVYPYDKFTSSFVAERGVNLVSYRRKKLGRTVKNKIWVEGEASKPLPLNMDDYTETLDINNDETNDWKSGSDGTVSLDSVTKAKGSYSIKHTQTVAQNASDLLLELPSGYYMDLNEYSSVTYLLRLDNNFNGHCAFQFFDVNNSRVRKEIELPIGEWVLVTFRCGKKYESQWQISLWDTSFKWEDVRKLGWYCYFEEGSGTGENWIDNFFIDHGRWSGFAEDSASQTKFEVREKYFLDDRLLSAADCLLVANHFLSTLKDSSRVIECEISPANFDLIQGKRLRVVDSTRGIDEYARMLEITHSLGEDKKTELKLSKEPLDWTPLFLDSTRKLELLSKGLERKVI